MTGCSGPTKTGRPCPHRGSPLCGHHAKIAEREAAEAAEEAAYWERMFTPRPGQPWRADPEWQAAKKDQLCDYPGENDNDRLVRSMSAIYRLHEIQARYRAAGV